MQQRQHRVGIKPLKWERDRFDTTAPEFRSGPVLHRGLAAGPVKVPVRPLPDMMDHRVSRHSRILQEERLTPAAD
jgi:hypothetical protein